MAGAGGGGCPAGNDFQWCFSQVKGAVDQDVAEDLTAFVSKYKNRVPVLAQRKCLNNLGISLSQHTSPKCSKFPSN
uniref:Uncharacterized protein n=1 Tax=Sciurus vulgaris TaxID=55149 RepID=A0A8D2CT93_SCIVU